MQKDEDLEEMATNEGVRGVCDKEGHLQISVLALSGIDSKRYRIMRVTVYVNKKPLHILSNSESTHNFLNVGVEKNVGRKTEMIVRAKSILQMAVAFFAKEFTISSHGNYKVQSSLLIFCFYL